MRKALRAPNKRRKAIAAPLEAGALHYKEALHEDGTVTTVDPTQVVDLLAKFSGNDLTATLSRIERSVRGLTALGTRRFLLEATATNEVLMAAAEMKRLAGQINVVIHSSASCLPATYPRSRRAS
jgi:hypothetical protein